MLVPPCLHKADACGLDGIIVGWLCADAGPVAPPLQRKCRYGPDHLSITPLPTSPSVWALPQVTLRELAALSDHFAGVWDAVTAIAAEDAAIASSQEL